MAAGLLLHPPPPLRLSCSLPTQKLPPSICSSRPLSPSVHRHPPLQLPLSSSLPLHGLRPLRWRPTRRASSLRRAGGRVVAEKTDVYRVIGTVVKNARDVLEAGTKLVPESVPRPLAQTGVAVAGILVASFLLKSIFSIVLFILAIGGISYFIFIYLNKDEDQGSGGGGGGGGGTGGRTTDQTLEEARRIMEKYK